MYNSVHVCDNVYVYSPRVLFTEKQRLAGTVCLVIEMQQYINISRIISLRQYRCIDTKSNRIDMSHIVIYQHIVAC